MSAKARITADFATQRDVASRLRIPASRAAELRQQVFDLHVRKANGSVMGAELKSRGEMPAAKNGKGSGSRSKKK